MSRRLEGNEYWLEVDGRSVNIDGYVYVLTVRTHKAIYPYPEYKITVYGDMVNKANKYYQRVYRELGDHWSTDILESGDELTCDVMRQLWPNGAPV
jgi:hypothetical protein